MLPLPTVPPKSGPWALTLPISGFKGPCFIHLSTTDAHLCQDSAPKCPKLEGKVEVEAGVKVQSVRTVMEGDKELGCRAQEVMQQGWCLN